MAIHGLGHDDVITESKLVELCPTLVYMQVAGSCVATHNTTQPATPTLAERKCDLSSPTPHNQPLQP